MKSKKTLQYVLMLCALSGLVALGANWPLMKKFVSGEFNETFLTADRYPGIRMITVQEAEDLFAMGAAVFFDARPAHLFRGGHIPGGRSLPYEAARKKVPDEFLAFPKERTVVIYCEGGDCQSSLGLAKILHEEGFEDLRVMMGGWADWTLAGLPEERDNG